MLKQQRAFYDAVNNAWRELVRAQVEAARKRQASVNARWDAHKAAAKHRWATRSGGRGQTYVSDIPEVAAQWHPDNPGTPETVLATVQGRPGVEPPYRWTCPVMPEHVPWPTWPKDRVQAGAGCPSCRKLTKLSDIPALAEQYAGNTSAHEVSFAAHDSASWVCRTWAVNPDTGEWHQVQHHFDAVIKERSQQRDGCLVCAGYVIDATNSLLTWFPELADQLADDSVDPATLSPSIHNASRRTISETDGPNAYMKLPWQCRHGHLWRATVLNRVQGGDCPDCSNSGISKEQVRVVAELAGLMMLIPRQPRDPRLPDGATDFASRKITIPSALKPQHWRYKAVEVDAIFRLPSVAKVVGVEYDGAFHHSSKLRDRSTYESEKSQVLVKAGELDVLVHLRLGDLPSVDSAHAIVVVVPERATAFEAALAVALAVEERFPASIPGLAAYRAAGSAQYQGAADDYIMATWGELRPPRRRPERSAERKPRRLRATEPHSGSRLTPVGEPYRNPEDSTQVLRNYRCSCGNSNLIPLVQSAVTSGNTRSCGCLQTAAKAKPRPVIDRDETRSARAWARERGHKVGDNGRVPERIIASYRLHQAGMQDELSEDGLIETRRVEQWARSTGRSLGAKGRLTAGVWLDYVAGRFGHGSS